MNYYHFLSNSIQKQHAVIFNKKGVIEIESVSGSGSKTKINGIPLTGRKALCHKDRILFGTKRQSVQLLHEHIWKKLCYCMHYKHDSCTGTKKYSIISCYFGAFSRIQPHVCSDEPTET